MSPSDMAYKFKPSIVVSLINLGVLNYFSDSLLSFYSSNSQLVRDCRSPTHFILHLFSLFLLNRDSTSSDSLSSQNSSRIVRYNLRWFQRIVPHPFTKNVNLLTSSNDWNYSAKTPHQLCLCLTFKIVFSYSSKGKSVLVSCL